MSSSNGRNVEPYAIPAFTLIQSLNKPLKDIILYLIIKKTFIIFKAITKK